MKNPEIRFIDDNIDWESKKLKSIYNSSCSGGTPESTNPLYYNGSIPFLTISDINDIKSINNTEKSITEIGLLHSTAKIVPKGSIALAMYASVGKVGILGIDMATSQAFHNMTFKDSITCDFIYHRLKKKERNNEWKSIISTGTQRNLNSEKVGNTIISIPSLKIQKEISSLLSDIDQKISSQEILVQKLKDTKSALLIKMFPQKNQSVPELRFNGFTNDWEQRKVKELCSISTGKSNTQDKINDGVYPFYVRSPIIEKSNKYLYDEEAVITIGDGVGTGKVFHYVNGKYDLHQRCYRMYNFSHKLNAKYFYHIFSYLFYDRVMSMTAKTSVDSVRLDMIADMQIHTPNIYEQQRISALFENLNSLITLHRCKSYNLFFYLYNLKNLQLFIYYFF